MVGALHPYYGGSSYMLDDKDETKFLLYHVMKFMFEHDLNVMEFNWTCDNNSFYKLKCVYNKEDNTNE